MCAPEEIKFLTSPEEMDSINAAPEKKSIPPEAEIVDPKIELQNQPESRSTDRAQSPPPALNESILASALDAIVFMDHAGMVLEWNPMAERTFGYTRDEALGREMAELIIPPALREKHRQGLRHYLKTGEGPVIGNRIDISAIRRDGTEFPVELTVIRIVEDPATNVPQFIGFVRDITERKRAEVALRESESRYDRIAANVPGMVYQFVLRPDGSIAFPFVSEGAREVYRLEPEAIREDAQNLLDLIHPEDAPGFAASVAASAEALSPWKWEGRFCLKNGEERWIQGASRPQREANGDVLWAGIVVDITRIKRAEHERARLFLREQQAREEAEEARKTALALATELKEERDKLEAANLNLQRANEELARAGEKLHTEQERQLKMMRYLRSTNKAAARMAPLLNPKEIGQAVVDMLQTEFSTAIVGVWLHDPVRRKLHLCAYSGTDLSSANLEAEIDLMLNAHKIAWVARYARPYVGSIAPTDLQFDQIWVARKGVQSAAILPLPGRESLLGVLAVFLRQEIPLGASEVLSTLAAIIAGNLEAAELRAARLQET